MDKDKYSFYLVLEGSKYVKNFGILSDWFLKRHCGDKRSEFDMLVTTKNSDIPLFGFLDASFWHLEISPLDVGALELLHEENTELFLIGNMIELFGNIDITIFVILKVD